MASDYPSHVLTTSLMHLHAFTSFRDLPDEVKNYGYQIERILLAEIYKSEPGSAEELDHKNRVLLYLQEISHPDVDDWLDRLAQDAERFTQG